MSFFFNFQHQSDSDTGMEAKNSNSVLQSTDVGPRCREVLADDIMLGSASTAMAKSISLSNGTQLPYVCVEDSDICTLLADHKKEDSSDNQRLIDTLSHSKDVEAGIYEGGFKVWECTVDLLNFLTAHTMQLAGATVLDLGCGVGLAGTFAALHGAKEVHFQDYNEHVLRLVTVPTVQQNLVQLTSSASVHCRYFSGDWATVVPLMSDALGSNRYNVILTSETVYKTETYDKLHHLFTSLLSADGSMYPLLCFKSGVAAQYCIGDDLYMPTVPLLLVTITRRFVAAKGHYFGVGGSVLEFSDYIIQRAQFNVDSVWKTSEGFVREILKLTRKQR